MPPAAGISSRRLGRTVLLLGAVTLGGLLALRGFEAMGGATGVDARFGLFSAVVLIPVHAIVSVSPLPGEAVAVANGLVFGFWLGAAFNWVGWMIAAVLEYGLFRTAAADVESVLARRGKRRRWLQGVPVRHPAFLILVRWIPMGGHVVNAAAGAARIPLWRHTWCSAISLVPVSLLFAGVATGVRLLAL